VVRRLARRPRSPPPQSLRHAQGRPAAPPEDAPPGPGKKSGPGTVAAIAVPWVQALSESQRKIATRVAKDLVGIAGQLRPHQLTPLHFAAIVVNWKSKYAPQTIWTYTVYLRMLARAIGAVAGRPDLPTIVPKVKVPKPRTEVVTAAELSTLMANAVPWFRVFLTLTGSLGLRHSEALDVRHAGYNADKRTVSFRAKGGETHTMPTTAEIDALFQNAPPGDAMTPLVERYKGAPVNRNSTWWEWKKLKRAHRLRDTITIHDIRRTVAVTSYELTKDLRMPWQILRHKNLATTAKYLEHVDTASIRPVLDALWTPKGPVQ